jgi:uncharacterized coiled-coil DUF342 family protein
MELSTPADVEKLRYRIAQLGKELEALNNSKEVLYKEKATFDNLLSSTIAEANELKTKKRAVDDEIKKKKELRTELNKELKTQNIKLKAQKPAVSSSAKPKIRQSADAIKKQIEAMQYAIETEGLSFEKETQYMDKIKRLRAELAQIAPADAESKKNREEFSTKKTQADLAHTEIQTLAAESTKDFESLTAKAKAIIDAKAKRVAIQAKLKDLKIQIEAKNQDLSETLSSWLLVAKEMPVMSAAAAEEEVINKFKSSKKLTKDDLLKLQRLAAR